ncbi:Lrp/AsnC family transcriptional regulator [Fibrisoma montanum]|uniref:Lrp/AsnC family transcriptional regulator n=1 Tax=Fibrisoma montanum TaxID=2305895 RepID=A0A418M0L6_9BACT|nr:Lrp/AsnC family transcriptional regulator [Fibrisoma montanum]RIV19083.1 Lrp/AsnC family transcriptional regulator [Fibrisoma montanum]
MQLFNGDNDNYKPDEVDFQLMQSLQRDGRESFSDIARRLGIAVSTVSKRYVNLVEKGILKIIGRVDPNKVGFNAYASILVQVDSVEGVQRIAKQIAELPEVSFLAMRTGEFDLEVNVMCRDNNHLLDLMNERIHTIAGVRKTETIMYLKVYKWGQPELSLIQNHNP